jgi:hypothetical protein
VSDLHWIQERFDPELMAFFGYETYIVKFCEGESANNHQMSLGTAFSHLGIAPVRGGVCYSDRHPHVKADDHTWCSHKSKDAWNMAKNGNKSIVMFNHLPKAGESFVKNVLTNVIGAKVQHRNSGEATQNNWVEVPCPPSTLT